MTSFSSQSLLSCHVYPPYPRIVSWAHTCLSPIARFSLLLCFFRFIYSSSSAFPFWFRFLLGFLISFCLFVFCLSFVSLLPLSYFLVCVGVCELILPIYFPSSTSSDLPSQLVFPVSSSLLGSFLSFLFLWIQN